MRRDFKEYANKTTVSEEGISKLRMKYLYVNISCKGEGHSYFNYKIDNMIVSSILLY